MKKYLIVLGLILLTGMLTAADPAFAELGMNTPQATIDPVTCTMTVTWTTDALSSSKVYYGTNCASLTYNATGYDCVAVHSVTFDVSGFGDVRIYFKAESATNCETEQSSCLFKKRGLCIQE